MADKPRGGFRWNLPGYGGNGGIGNIDRDNGGVRPQPRIPAFMPGQQNALADQLQAGFGGGLGHWQNFLGNTYSSMAPIQPFQYGDPKKKPEDDKNGKPDDKGGKREPYTPPYTHGDAGILTQSAAASPLLQAQAPMQMAQPSGLLNLTPEMLMALRQMRMR